MTCFHYGWPKTETELEEYFVSCGTRIEEMDPVESARVTWNRLQAMKSIYDRVGIDSSYRILQIYVSKDSDQSWNVPMVFVNIDSLKSYAGGSKVKMASLLADAMEAPMLYYIEGEFLRDKKRRATEIRETIAKWEKES